jgi:hypothetical protein
MNCAGVVGGVCAYTAPMTPRQLWDHISLLHYPEWKFKDSDSPGMEPRRARGNKRIGATLYADYRFVSVPHNQVQTEEAVERDDYGCNEDGDESAAPILRIERKNEPGGVGANDGICKQTGLASRFFLKDVTNLQSRNEAKESDRKFSIESLKKKYREDSQF